MAECIAGADAVVIANDAADWATVDWKSVAHAMKGTLIVDGRNTLDADLVLEAGLEYWGVGRPDLGKLRVGLPPQGGKTS